MQSSFQMIDGIGPAVDNLASTAGPQEYQVDFTPVGQFSIPRTPPGTPTQQTVFSLPHMIEFETEFSPLGTGSSHEQLKSQLHPPPHGLYRGSEWTPPLSPPANTGAYYVTFTGESLGDDRALGRRSLPRPGVRARIVTRDPFLGEMFAEAAQAAGRQFYPPQQDQAKQTVVPSHGNPAPAAPSEELKKNWPPEPWMVSTHVTKADPSRGPGETPNFYGPQNEAVWWHISAPPAPQLTTTMTTTTVPNGEILPSGVVQCERPEAALGHSVKQGQCVVYPNRSPPHTEMVSGFTPVHQAFSASLGKPVAAAPHYRPLEPRFITFAESVQWQRLLAKSPLQPTQGNNQEAPIAAGGPQVTRNPFPIPPHRASSDQYPLPGYHRHTVDTAMTGPGSSAQKFSEGRAMEGSFRESIRSAASSAMESIRVCRAY